MRLSAARRGGLRDLLPAVREIARPGGMAGAVGLLLFGSLVAACRPQGETAAEVTASWSVEPRPPLVGLVSFSLRLTDRRTGRPVSGARVRVEAIMSHPGMEPAFGTAREVAPGRYEAPLELDMAGDWILLVDATLRDGRTLQRQVSLAGVREGPHLPDPPLPEGEEGEKQDRPQRVPPLPGGGRAMGEGARG